MHRTRLVLATVLAAGLTPGQGSPTPAPTGPEPKFPGRWRGDDPSAPYARDVRLSANGRRLVVGWQSGVRLWDLRAGRSVTLHADSEKGVNDPLISPDGRWVVGIRGLEPDWELVIWAAATGKQVRAEPKVTRKPADYWRPAVLGFDRGGGAWVVRPAGVVDRVEVPAGKVTRTVKLPFTAGAWGQMILSPDGRWLALGGGTVFAVRRTDPGAGWVVVERHAEPEDSDCGLPQPTHCPIPCGFSPDGRRLVTYDHKGGGVAVWRLGKKPAKLASRVVELTPWTHLDDLKFTPDGKVLAFVLTARPQDRSATELRVWDAATLAETSRVAPPVGVDGFAFTPDGKRVALTHPDGTLTVREWAGGEAPKPEVRFKTGRIFTENKDRKAAYSPDRKVVLKVIKGPDKRTRQAVRLHDARTGKPLGPPIKITRITQGAGISALAVSPDRRTVAVGVNSFSDESGQVSVYDAKTGDWLATYRKPLGDIHRLSFCDARTVLIDADPPGGK